MEHQYAPAGMSTSDAEKVSTALQERAADLIDLSLTLKHVHWNVVGFGFMAVHEMMDQQTGGVRDMIDALAERITTLGGVAAGLPGQIAKMRTSDHDYELGRGPVTAHLGALDKVYTRVAEGHREAIKTVAPIDAVTEDLLIGQTATLDLYHWFIRAHLSDTTGHLATEGTEDELDAAATAAELLQPGHETEEDVREEAVVNS